MACFGWMCRGWIRSMRLTRWWLPPGIPIQQWKKETVFLVPASFLWSLQKRKWNGSKRQQVKNRWFPWLPLNPWRRASLPPEMKFIMEESKIPLHQSLSKNWQLTASKFADRFSATTIWSALPMRFWSWRKKELISFSAPAAWAWIRMTGHRVLLKIPVQESYPTVHRYFLELCSCWPILKMEHLFLACPVVSCMPKPPSSIWFCHALRQA